MSRWTRILFATAALTLSGCGGLPWFAADCAPPAQIVVPAPGTFTETFSGQDEDYLLVRSEDGQQFVETYTREGKRYRVVYRVASSRFGTY